jgi:membrane fusion protein, multidrug efflux system
MLGRKVSVLSLMSMLLLTFSLIGCSKSNKAEQAATAPAVEVSVIDVQPETVPIFTDFVSETYARDEVQVRGRVDGYIEKRLFTPGSYVKAGQLLYILDLRPYRAEVAKAKGDLSESQANLTFAREQVELIEAEAQLAQAEAELIKAKNDVTRLTPLVKEEAAPKQDLENAIQTQAAAQANYNAKKANVDQKRLTTRVRVDAAQAQVDASKATLDQAELNLGYATIRAQISGRVGDSQIEVGGLVTKNSPQPLTTIVPLDPIWVRFQVSESEYLKFRGEVAQGARRRDYFSSVPIQLITANGEIHPQKGKIQNTLNRVDTKTGSLEVQATFPNPQRDILPGQFGRVQIQTEERQNVMLVPQRAIQQLQNMRTVLAVDSDNKVVARTVATAERVGDRWIIQQGLKPGDRIIVEGMQKVRPGSIVKTKPYQQETEKRVAEATSKEGSK